MSCPNNPQHDFENIGNTQRIDRSTISVEYECLNCGKTEYQYYEDIIDQEEEE